MIVQHNLPLFYSSLVSHKKKIWETTTIYIDPSTLLILLLYNYENMKKKT